MTGLVLKRLGHTVRILELSPTPLLQTQGAGIVFGSQSQEYFSKFIKTKRKFPVSSFLRQTLNKHGESIPEHEERYEQKMVSWDLVYFVLRWEFDGYANEYVDTDEIVSVEYEGKAMYEYGCRAVDVRDKGEKVELEFEDRNGNIEKVEADMVIGADGPSSTIRRILMPEVERKYAGYVAWRGTVLESDASKELRDTFVDHFTFFHDHRKGIQILTFVFSVIQANLAN
jgi:2-polyprenyl-6-methoxyphenol hydroxylase-like FAD-dependent oxidoreductase